jgi:biotin operon repressor
MSDNPDMTTTQSKTLALLTAQLQTLTEAVNRLQQGAGGLSSEVPADTVHPIEARILDAVATGQIVSLTAIATKHNLQRTGVNYHAKRLVRKGVLILIEANRGKYLVDYVMKRGAIALPGVD